MNHTQPTTDPHGRRLSAARLAAMAAALSVPDGGFTVDPVTGTDMRTGYAVSVHPECERRYRRPVTADDLTDYLTDYLTHTRTASALAMPGRVFGGWRDPGTGRVYLDASAVVPTLAAAFVLGRRAGQHAVFDLAAERRSRSRTTSETPRDTRSRPPSRCETASLGQSRRSRGRSRTLSRPLIRR
ncbi:hypothetical protein QRX60_48820 [Amycolatopsis mongoliensis]|uniref:Uncharacterized protein n=1 Tax=Amycolatopsis mongoliensis TaxID=715475 RepID=A0A9Y2NHF3_9PSEU|nr:hypothetical protein [Amycolatopsis sp. 4-36]WIY01829.1 hypothetical protein QRX60_48820 [Amycolatopsis sp. 4-36]